MATKKVTLYIDPKDPHCAETEEFLRGFDIVLRIHDIRLHPLNARQLSDLLGHIDSEHFLNISAPSAKVKKLDPSSASRRELLELIAEDNSLLRKPVIVWGRLRTLGCDRRTIMEMLQLKTDTSQPELQPETAA